MSRWPFEPVPPPGLTDADEERIAEELDLHVEMLTDELEGEGMDRRAARAEARRRFGDPERYLRRLRVEAGHGPGAGRSEGFGTTGRGMMTMLGRVVRDVRFALRGLRRAPGFAAAAVLTLAIAIAGNTAIFSVLDEAVLRALPFPEPDRLVFVNGVHRSNGQEAVRLASVPEFRDWRERVRSLVPLVAADPNSFTMTGASEAERVLGELVSEGFFELLGGMPALGRAFTAEEHAVPDAHPVVVLSHDLWQRAFGGDPEVIGRAVELNDRTVEVVGVTPPGFAGSTLTADLWVPLSMISLVASSDRLESRGSRFLPVIAGLAPGVGIPEAQRELDSVAARLQVEHPDTHEDRFARLVPFREGFLGTTDDLLWIVFAAGMLLLAIAAANVANLLLVRAHRRGRELTIRRAMGAGAGRVAAQLLVESLVMATAGGALGFVLARGILQVGLPLIPASVLPAYAEPTLSPRAFAFTLLVLVLVGLAAGVLPALTSVRSDLAGVLRGGHGTVGRGRRRSQHAFVVTQVALALALLTGSGLLGRSFRAQLSVDPGLDVSGIHVLRVQPARSRYPDAASLNVYFTELRRRVSEVPGVLAVALSSDFPFRGGSSGTYVTRPEDPEALIRVHRHSVGQAFFELLGVALRDGRAFEARDGDADGWRVVVTEAFAERVFPGEGSVVGRQVHVERPTSPTSLAEIVGVVENVRFRNLTQSMLDEPNSPDVFFVLGQSPSRTIEVAYRVSGDPSEVAGAVRRAVSAVDPATPPFALASLQGLYESQTATARLAAVLMGGFSGLALLLSAVGLYGVLSFTVTQRAAEIAVRRALGARSAHVAGGVVADSLKLAGVGVFLGGALALVGGRALERLLFQVAPSDPVIILVTGSVVLGVAGVAAAVPAIRAARRDPSEALGVE